MSGYVTFPGAILAYPVKVISRFRTVSIFGDVMSRKSTTKVAPLGKCICHSTFKGNKHTQYGLDQEKATAGEYLSHMEDQGRKVSVNQEVGLYICCDDNALAGTPDAVVSDESCGEEGLAEWKNISEGRHMTILELFESKKKAKSLGSFCLTRDKKTQKLHLKKHTNTIIRFRAC